VPLRHLRHVPPQMVWRLWLIVYRTELSITLCVILNAKKWEIVLVTLCIQIEWLFYNAFWCDADSIHGTGARAHTFTNSWAKIVKNLALMAVFNTI